MIVMAWSLVELIWQGVSPGTFEDLVPSALAMSAMTASGFLLGGASLSLYTYGNPSHSRQTTAQFVGTLIIICSLGYWATYHRSDSSGGALGASLLNQSLSFSVPIACAILTCLGLAILTLPVRTASGYRPSQYFAGILLLLGTVPGIGHLYDFSSLLESTQHLPIDGSTSIMCVFLGLALLCIHPTEGFMRPFMASDIGGALLRRLVPVVIGLPLVAGWLCILAQRQSWYPFDFGIMVVIAVVLLILLICLWYLAGLANRIDQERYSLVRAWLEQETRLRLAAAAARIGYWRWVESKNAIEIDQVSGELLGLSSGSQLTLGSFIQAIRQEDRRDVMRAIEKAKLDGQSFGVECRPVTTSHAQWINVRGVPSERPDSSTCRFHGVIVDISDRRNAQDALWDSQQRLNSIVQSAMDAIITADQDQRILLFNKAAEQLFQCRAEEAIGRPISQFVPERVRERHHSHMMAFQQSTVKARQMGRPGLVKALRADGHEIPIEASISKVTVGGHSLCTIILRDITDRLKSEDAIRERETRFQHMADSAPVMMFITSSTGDCIYLNRQWYGFTGQTEETGLDSGWLNYVHEDDRRHVIELLDDCGNVEPRRLECRIRRYDGEFRWTLCSVLSLVDERERREGCIGSIIDVTDHKLAEQTLKRSAEELEQQVTERTAALQRSQKQLRALTDQLTRAEHQERRRIAGELHDYLAQLLVAARLKLAQDSRPLKTDKDLALARDLERILDEALTYTRSLVAKLSPPVLYHLGLPAALQWLAEQMEEHQLVVETAFDVSPALPKFADDVAAILFQSVRELLFNVMKHAGSSHAQITLRATPDQQLMIMVTDQGCGFDPSQLDQASTIPTSFGLFSIKERMETLGGSIHIHSRIGHGTSVTLLCPLTTLVKANSLSPASDGDGGTSIALASQASRSLRILLVDDHAMVRQGIRALLERHPDMTVVGEAWDGQHAYELVDTLHPDVIVMDANMPRLDGIEATRRIKQTHPHMVIIGLSVQTATQVATSMLQAGASSYLTKESAGEQLYETILDAVASRRLPPSDLE